MIRKAKIEDTEQIAELYKQLHQYHCEIAPQKHIMPKEELFNNIIFDILSKDEQTVLVYEDMAIKGYALLKIIEVNDEMKPPRKVCFIDCIGVDKSCRRQGIGTGLFNGIKNFALEKGCDSIQLGVDAKNESAKRFYEKIGLLPRSIIMAMEID